MKKQTNDNAIFLVTVDEAIAKGRKTIVYPFLLIMLLLPLLVILFTPGIFPVLLSPMIFLLAAVLAFVYRAYTIPKWMIWAFSTVRNVHELQRRAEYAMLIPNKINSGFRYFEIWNQQQKQEWNALQYRFNTADIFFDNPAIPAKSVIYYSIWIKLFYVFLALVSIGFGVLLFILPKGEPFSKSALWGYFVGAVIIVSMGWFGITCFKQLLNRKPQLIFSDEGLVTSDAQFYSWGELLDVKMITKGIGKHRTTHLQFYVKGRLHDFELDGLTAGRNKLDLLLRMHRDRFMQKI